jgi:hypothetical protein
LSPLFITLLVLAKCYNAGQKITWGVEKLLVLLG